MNRPSAFVPPPRPAFTPLPPPPSPARLTVAEKRDHVGLLARGVVGLVAAGAAAWGLLALGWPAWLLVVPGLGALPALAALGWGVLPLWQEYQHGQAALLWQWELLNEHQAAAAATLAGAAQHDHRFLGDPPPPPPEEPITFNPAPVKARTPRPPVGRYTPSEEMPTQVLHTVFTPEMRTLVQMAINGVALSQGNAAGRGLNRSEWEIAKERLITAGVLLAHGERKVATLDDTRFRDEAAVERFLEGG